MGKLSVCVVRDFNYLTVLSLSFCFFSAATFLFHCFCYHRFVLETVCVESIIGNGVFVVGVGEQGTGYNMVGSASVAAKHNVFHSGKACQGFNVGIVRLHSQRVCKKEQIVNLPFHYSRAHLLISTERSAL